MPQQHGCGADGADGVGFALAGKGVANPAGAIGSAAMLLRHSFGLEQEAAAIEKALEVALASGARTPDLGGTATTRQVGDAVIRELHLPRESHRQ